MIASCYQVIHEGKNPTGAELSRSSGLCMWQVELAQNTQTLYQVFHTRKLVCSGIRKYLVKV